MERMTNPRSCYLDSPVSEATRTFFTWRHDTRAGDPIWQIQYLRTMVNILCTHYFRLAILSSFCRAITLFGMIFRSFDSIRRALVDLQLGTFTFHSVCARRMVLCAFDSSVGNPVLSQLLPHQRPIVESFE